MAASGVYPVYQNQFQIGADQETMMNIAEMETFSVTFDNGVEEWKPFESEGWTRRLMTAKSVTIAINGKRNAGDPGNDFIAGLAFANGRAAEATLQWTFPDGTKVVFEDAVINVIALGSGDSTGVAPLEFEALSNGRPKVIIA